MQRQIEKWKPYFAIHQFLEEMALTRVQFSFFNKDYQKDILLSSKADANNETISNTEETEVVS